MHYPHVSRIGIYLIKSLDAVELQQAEIGLHSLLHDREFALLANDGRFINGKRTGLVNELKAEYHLEKRVISLSPRAGGNVYTFHLINDARKLETYLSEFSLIKLK